MSGIDPTIGVTLGKYQLVANVGRGGMSDVFLALSRGEMNFTKLVVLKCMRVTDQEATFTSMFFDEVRLAARLNHPNIVTTFDVGEASGTYFMAMEFLDGQPLHHVWRAWSGARQPQPRVWAVVMAEVLSGLAYAHELRDFDGRELHVVHRDVSPQNIFITYDGAVKLMDFGIAKAASNNTHTDTGTVKGKVRYMSPEQLQGVKVDQRADLFSAGVVLWELIANQKLLSGEMAPVMHRLLSAEPLPRLSTVVKDVSPRLDSLVARALEKDPEKRFQTANEMRMELLAYVREVGTLEQGELGRALSKTFSDHRARVRAQVEAHVMRASQAHSIRDLGSLHLGSGQETPGGGNVKPDSQVASGIGSGMGAALIPNFNAIGSEATQAAATRIAPLSESPSVTSSPSLSSNAPVPAPTAPPRITAPASSGPSWKWPAVILLALVLVGGASFFLRTSGNGGVQNAEDQRKLDQAKADERAAAEKAAAQKIADDKAAAEKAAADKIAAEKAAADQAANKAALDRAEAEAKAKAAEEEARAAAEEAKAKKNGKGKKTTVASSKGVHTETKPETKTAMAEKALDPVSPPPTVVAEATPPPPPAPEVKPENKIASPAPVPPPVKPAVAQETPAPAQKGLTPAQINAVKNANRDRIQDCYDHATLDGKGISGQVKVTVSLTGVGGVTDVNETSTILERGAQLEHCIQETVRSWKFPPTADGAATQVTYTFNFK